MLEWLKRLLKRRKRSVESVESVEESDLKEWMARMEKLKEHPLTQAKIINYEILLGLTGVLKSMDEKLERLEKLDEILSILIEVRDELRSKGIRSEKFELALEKLSEISLKEKRILEALEGEMSAEEVAEKLGISRSTASYHLNRLARKGVVEKVSRGRRVYFRSKNLSETQNF